MATTKTKTSVEGGVLVRAILDYCKDHIGTGKSFERADFEQHCDAKMKLFTGHKCYPGHAWSALRYMLRDGTLVGDVELMKERVMIKKVRGRPVRRQTKRPKQRRLFDA